MKFIITAGGQGTKIWPMSRDSKPKQFQNIIGDQSLYQHQVEILLRAYSPQDIYVSTKQSYAKYIIEQTPEIPLENIIIEPEFKKNRGPGEGFALLKLSLLHPNEPFMLVQSDCVRDPAERFLDMIAVADKLVQRDRKFITGGQKALYPVMGIDYINLGNRISDEQGIDVYQINNFVERLSTAEETKKLIENFHISTHSNHMCWYPELALAAYEKYRPDWYQSLMEIRDVFGKPDEKDQINRIYQAMAAGATEDVTKHVMPEGYLMLLPYRWTDVGTWNSLYEYFNKEDDSSYVDGKVINIGSKRSLIKGGSKKLLAVMGMDDVVVIDTDDVLLICPRNKSDDIKKIFERIEEDGLQEYL